VNYKDYFSNEKLGIREDLLEMTIPSFALYFILLLLFNSQPYQKMLHYLQYSIDTVRYCCGRTLNAENFTTSAENNKPPSPTETGTGILRVQNLTKSYGRKQIVRNLNFHLEKNKCFGLLGTNGAGKSTTFRMLTKYSFFDKGNITISEGATPISISKAEVRDT
jgi:ABC-type bacteriocin/lantibiotic exporter with double-glycine peptidase domain